VAGPPLEERRYPLEERRYPLEESRYPLAESTRTARGENLC